MTRLNRGGGRACGGKAACNAPKEVAAEPSQQGPSRRVARQARRKKIEIMRLWNVSDKTTRRETREARRP